MSEKIYVIYSEPTEWAIRNGVYMRIAELDMNEVCCRVPEDEVNSNIEIPYCCIKFSDGDLKRVNALNLSLVFM